jgi:3-hydroxy-9,10-secoandrosta-1,3,5(10)-triene-9,17-dione monooxygenase reductase component
MTQNDQNKNLNFKNSMSTLASGISIFTIYDKQYIHGITISSFDSVSLNPNLILFNIDKTTTNIEKYLNCESFIIHILSEKQKNISNYFAQSNKDQNILKDWFKFSHNNYILKNSLCFFHCKIWKIVEAGDSYIIIGEVLNCQILNDQEKPLIYFNRNYFSLNNKIDD